VSAVLAADTGLVARPAKMSVELHPPVDADKGMVVRELANGATGALYAGDDLGDLPAFAALRALRGEGLVTLAVAVNSPELPAGVRAAAELVVDGPDGVLGLLDGLLDGVTDAPSGPPEPPP
jgi:trehalose 6-phosphate phosphatase